MVIHIIRLIFLLAVVALTTTFALHENVIAKGSTYITLYLVIPSIIAAMLLITDMFWRKKRLQVLGGMFFGLLGGMAIAGIMALIIDLVVRIFPGTIDVPIVQLVKVFLGAASVFICVSFVMQTKDDFRFVIPYVEFSRQSKGARPILLDTSVIIDGRIADIGETRILESEVIVPQFVLMEIQSIADSDDKLRRNRGRRGLDVLQLLRNSDKIDIRIFDTLVPSVEQLKEVDEKLVALAEHLNARIVTNDYNLNKVSQLHEVDVININDLANALKPVVLPGETMSVAIVKPGQEADQGVGYLDDGTMIVVTGGRDCIDKEITVVVTSVLQTSAGRMIFARKSNGSSPVT